MLVQVLFRLIVVTTMSVGARPELNFLLNCWVDECGEMVHYHYAEGAKDASVALLRGNDPPVVWSTHIKLTWVSF